MLVGGFESGVPKSSIQSLNLKTKTYKGLKPLKASRLLHKFIKNDNQLIVMGGDKYNSIEWTSLDSGVLDW